MKKLMVIICSLFLCVALQAQNKDIVNLWEFSAPDAPYGYQDGTFLIKEQDGKLSGEVKIQYSTVAIKEIKKEKDHYACSFYIDGQAVDVKLKTKGKNQLEGQALSDGMDIPFTCKPAKK
ncbi:hypothetical protein [Massilibacteroides vaginae]|uniref:hypothetical protein n=1 Tax=Massilibacteroides vaginae TaxID=1673718 RepID=UPI00111C6A91|nr:hypothetical protein [Massilibacteroides vaginae]